MLGESRSYRNLFQAFREVFIFEQLRVLWIKSTAICAWRCRIIASFCGLNININTIIFINRSQATG